MSACVHARARGGCVIQTCRNENPRYRRMGMTSCTGSVRGGFWGFEKIQLTSSVRRRGWLSELAVALRWVSHMVAVCVWGGRWKSLHRKIVYLAPYVEKPFNSKVIKCFVPELRSRKCFCVSGFLCALWTFYVFFTYPFHGYVTFVPQMGPR